MGTLFGWVLRGAVALPAAPHPHCCCCWHSPGHCQKAPPVSQRPSHQHHLPFAHTKVKHPRLHGSYY